MLIFGRFWKQGTGNKTYFRACYGPIVTLEILDKMGAKITVP
jgi:hypothetical protein